MLGIILEITIIWLALFVVFHKDFLASLILYGLVGLVFVLLLLMYKAPDVALSGIVVGALITGLFIFAHEKLNENVELSLLKGFTVLPLLFALATNSMGISSETYRAYLSVWSMGNLVTEILAGWRLYDSIGEAFILFAAALGFSIALRRGRR
ncbi:hydrogenase subunit MbhD domain-containing protein [Pyrococcus sp. ST04]|uniref:hydrogenase subunit MbhD domain-containing protein n=1 Tax=Pyrococcus sp. ST04 TaxID=1183377 RepID=UPI0002605FE7|nr:hydrogenase subunit MbhD domain-containing protein [Pyrococcus sp. ST04]AFK22734.1 putative monovalent cation/H+ antiporter subunit B [Pyrococcus sp. ST04]